MKLIDLTGKTIGDWTAIKRINPPIDSNMQNRPWYLIECKRGHQDIVLGQTFSNCKKTKCHKCMAIEKEKKKHEEKSHLKTVINKNRDLKIGEERISNDGTLMKIIDYYNSYDVLIEFQDNYKAQVHTEYNNFKKGTVSNPYHILLYGRGYIGEGIYEQSIGRKAVRSYDAWRKMFDRCYNGKQPAYSDCNVCEEWYNYQNFAKWYNEHYYEIKGQIMQLDKDWLSVGNRIYCPDNCCIAPHLINSCLITHSKTKDIDLPNGIQRINNGRFKARCSVEGHRKTLGTYETIEEAFNTYKNFKIKYVEELAERFKKYIPQNLYNAVIHYKDTFDERRKYLYEI